MNIKKFKSGDIITRINHVKGDSSYCGDRLEFLGHDENSKLIFFRNTKIFENDIIDLSYARDKWNEGWNFYPETLYKKIVDKLKDLKVIK
jgi:hypothetical protein